MSIGFYDKIPNQRNNQLTETPRSKLNGSHSPSPNTTVSLDGYQAEGVVESQRHGMSFNSADLKAPIHNNVRQLNLNGPRQSPVNVTPTPKPRDRPLDSPYLNTAMAQTNKFTPPQDCELIEIDDRGASSSDEDVDVAPQSTGARRPIEDVIKKDIKQAASIHTDGVGPDDVASKHRLPDEHSVEGLDQARAHYSETNKPEFVVLTKPGVEKDAELPRAEGQESAEKVKVVYRKWDEKYSYATIHLDGRTRIVKRHLGGNLPYLPWLGLDADFDKKNPLAFSRPQGPRSNKKTPGKRKTHDDGKTDLNDSHGRKSARGRGRPRKVDSMERLDRERSYKAEKKKKRARRNVDSSGDHCNPAPRKQARVTAGPISHRQTPAHREENSQVVVHNNSFARGSYPHHPLSDYKQINTRLHIALTPYAPLFVVKRLRSCMTISTFFAQIIDICGYEGDHDDIYGIKVTFECKGDDESDKTKLIRERHPDTFYDFLEILDKAESWAKEEERGQCNVFVELFKK